jgi:hypothetical protein
MLQWLYKHVASICFKCFRHMLSVSSKCYKSRFRCCIYMQVESVYFKCFRYFICIQVFHLDVTKAYLNVAYVRNGFQVFSGVLQAFQRMLHMFAMTFKCFQLFCKCFSCFEHMLQVFYLNVAKVDLVLHMLQ